MPVFVLLEALQTQLLIKVIALDSMNSLFSEEDTGVVNVMVEMCLGAILTRKHFDKI